jgi:hypothetical protein
MNKRLLFSKNINNEGLTGLLEIPKIGMPILFCYCNEEVADEILQMQKQIADNKILMCEQQLLGFFYQRNHRDDVIGLIVAMGMTYDEWNILKKEYNLYYIPKNTIDEINDYFANNK